MKSHEYYELCKELKLLKEDIAASRGLKCPNCEDSGGFPGYDGFGQVVQQQCEFCWTVTDSIFNRRRKK